MSKEENKQLFEKAIQLFENKIGDEYQYILRRLKELSSDDCLDDYMYDTCEKFKLNMDSINDYKKFIDNNYELYSQISSALFINDDGNVSLQKTISKNLSIYILFKGNNIVNFYINKFDGDIYEKDISIDFMINVLKKYF
jgi:hypothetical protein